MKSKYVCVLALSVIMAGAVVSAMPLLDRLQHVLDLTEAQIVQIREAEEHLGAVVHRVESAVHSGSLSPEDGRAHLQAAREDLEHMWQEVLTEEQLARWHHSLETDRAPNRDSDRVSDVAPNREHESDRVSDVAPNRVTGFWSIPHRGAVRLGPG
jgi:hypothetical protein